MTVAATGEPPWGRTVTEAALSEPTVMAREKVAVGEVASGTPMAPFAGVVAVTVGAGRVVKLQLTGAARVAPSAAEAAVEIWATYVVPVARSEVGLMTTRLLAES